MSPRPLVLIDRAGVVRLVNSPFERCLGWSRDELVGERWIDHCTPASARVATAACLREAFERSRCNCRIVALGKDGTRYDVAMEVTRVGDGEEAALVASFVEAIPLRDPAAVVGELRYEVSIDEDDFGRLRWISDPSGRSSEPPEGTRTCYEALHGIDRPCKGCPLIGPGPWPRTSIRNREGGERVFEVITASLTPEQSAEVRVHRLPDSLLSKLLEARISALAESSGLSGREFDVLRYLLMGRSLKDIAEILGISLRTVKFHQANVVEKLGADSRADLTRLIF